MTIVSAEELRGYMGGITFNTRALEAIENTILPGLQQELEMHLNRLLEPAQVRESVYTDEMGFVTLRFSPVWKVLNAGYSNGAAAPIYNYTPLPMVPDPSVDRRIDFAGTGMPALPYRYDIGALGLTAPYFGYGQRSRLWIWIEYIAGAVTAADQAMKLALLRVAAREVEHQMPDMVGLRSGTLEAADASDPRPKGWQPEELARLSRYRRRVIR